MKSFVTCLLYLLFSFSGLIADDVIGFWKTIDNKTNRAQSIIGIYEYNGICYGRIIATYDNTGKRIKETIDTPRERAPGVEGNPFYVGLDFMWNLKKNGSHYSDGKILDPEQGKVYDAQMWTKNGNLIVRGHIWIFGVNQTWLPATKADFPAGFQPPDLAKLEPQIPTVKR
ncbi:MAG: DUF2147 domain-containing protein [Parachlamydiaceae bacterium]|nr:DUF2147 domain-containing protein [Parachlamydiaceae bacterium]